MKKLKSTRISILSFVSDDNIRSENDFCKKQFDHPETDALSLKVKSPYKKTFQAIWFNVEIEAAQSQTQTTINEIPTKTSLLIFHHTTKLHVLY